MIELKNETLKSIHNGNINCIYFDSRKDITKVKIEVEGSSRFFPGSIEEEITLYAWDQVASFCFTLPQKNLTLGEPLIVLPDKILKDLSIDQAYGYRSVTVIRTGVLPENLINLEIGPVSHSRWLTIANRFCRL